MAENNLKNKTFNGLKWKFLERSCAQIVSLIVSIVLARLLLPSDYSVVSIVTIFFTFCNLIISSGLNTALIQKKNADLLDYSTVLYVTLAISILMYIIMFFTAPLIANIYHKDILIPVLRVMSLTFFINGFKSILCSYVSSRLEFRKFFLSTIVGTVISAFVGIIMALKGFGAWALVAQQMTNSFIDTLILFITTKFKIALQFSFVRLKKLFGYGWKIFAAGIITVIYDQILPLVVGIKYSPEDLAYYSKGQNYPGIVNNTINDTLMSVVFPVMSKLQDDKKAVLSATRRFIGVSSYIVFPAMIGFFAVSRNFVRVVLTDKWLPIAPFIQIFAFSYMFNIIQTGNLQTIKAIGRSDITLILEVIKKVLYLIVIIIFIKFSDSPLMLALSSIVCTAIATIVNTFPNRKLINYKYKNQIMDLLPNFVISIIMGLVILSMNRLNIPLLLLFLMQIAAGALIYLALSIFTHNSNYSYIVDNIKKYFNKNKIKN